MKRAIAMWMLLAAGAARAGDMARPPGPTWTNVVIETVDFRQVTLSNTLQFVQDEVNRQDTAACVTVRYDFRGPDRRWTAPANSPLDELVTFRARAITAGEALRILMEVSNLRCAIDGSNVTVALLPRAVLFVVPDGGWRPGIYQDFDQFVSVPTNGDIKIRQVLQRVAEVTRTDIQFDPTLNELAETTALAFSEPEYRAMELLKICLDVLRQETGKPLGLSVPNMETVRGGWLDETGHALAIGHVRGVADARMLLRQLGRDKPDAYEEAVARFTAFTDAERVHFEPSLNALWIVGGHSGWWAGMDYWLQPSEAVRRYNVSIDRNADAIMTPVARDAGGAPVP